MKLSRRTGSVREAVKKMAELPKNSGVDYQNKKGKSVKLTGNLIHCVWNVGLGDCETG